MRSYLHGPAQTWPLLYLEAKSPLVKTRSPPPSVGMFAPFSPWSMYLLLIRSSFAAFSCPPNTALFFDTCPTPTLRRHFPTVAVKPLGGLDAQRAEGAWIGLDLLENAGCPVPIDAAMSRLTALYPWRAKTAKPEVWCGSSPSLRVLAHLY